MTPKRYALSLVLLIAALGSAGVAVAEQVSLLHSVSFLGSRQPLIALRQREPADGPTRPVGSLFAGKYGTSLFAPYPMRNNRAPVLAQPGPGTTQVDRIRHLIAQAEAGANGYDAVQHGARIRPAKAPTQMTIAEIYAWIEATPGQHHAIGRYQFIPATLKRLVALRGVATDKVFSPQVQDYLAEVLLAEAGLHAFQKGDIERHNFMNNLAKIWAGLPTSSGQSHYHGLAGNRATMTWAYFDAEMGRIFPG